MEKKVPSLVSFPTKNIRNFSIIAHIDHGKSTLADRLMETTGTISAHQKNEQVLDKLQVEKERGITVKAQTVSLFYSYKGEEYLLNLIDTPGHVDFNYEVSRSLHACQGALLLVDASQGVEAQTMANFYLAFDADLAILPVINKIDMTNAQPERVEEEIARLFDLYSPVKISAKNGIGIKELLEEVVLRIPSPQGEREEKLKALLFDSWFDEYRGVVCLIYVAQGTLNKGDKITTSHTGKVYEILELGIMYPDPVACPTLYAGQVGYIITGMKSVAAARVGDTIYHTSSPVKPFSGFREAKPMVFAGVYPINTVEYELLRDAIEKLTLNDPSVKTEKESSDALGFGFRCGFLGLLHMDVFRQRLEQEYKVNVIITSPTVLYKVSTSRGTMVHVENPSDFPDAGIIERIEEPVILATIITPKDYLGSILALCQDRRGVQKEMNYLDDRRIILKYHLPLSEVVTDFYDKLKSCSAGYASFDYEESGYQEADMVKMNILLNGKQVDALSLIVHKDKAYSVGLALTSKLKEIIPRHMFQVAIQASIGAKVIARETISALRKDVIAKCYGGDITRKRKLLEKQKEGKEKMKQIGEVELPQEAFVSLLTISKK